MKFKMYKKQDYIPYNLYSPKTRAEVEVIEIPIKIVKPDCHAERFKSTFGFNNQQFHGEFSKKINSLLREILNDAEVYTKADIDTFHFYPVYKTVVKEDGFNQEEYTSITHLLVPRDDGDVLVALNHLGKVAYFTPNGNISVQRGAPTWSTKGQLCVDLCYEIPYRVKLTDE